MPVDVMVVDAHHYHWDAATTNGDNDDGSSSFDAAAAAAARWPDVRGTVAQLRAWGMAVMVSVVAWPFSARSMGRSSSHGTYGVI